jgi:hypothetical protein
VTGASRPPRASLVAALVLFATAARAEGGPSALELAERLRLLGDPRGCTVEALRHAYLTPQERERGFERAALCLGESGRYAEAERLLVTLEPPRSAASVFRLCFTRVFLERGPGEECERGQGEPGADRLAVLASYTPVMHSMRSGRWDEARRRLDAGAPAPALDAWRSEDAQLLARAEARRRRSPWLAGALSAAVPGLGRVYIGRWQDGLMSAVLVGVPAGFAASGFAADGTSSVRGWILGTLAGVLYVGNVYGSYVGVGVEERDAERRLRAEVELAYRSRAEP